MIVCVDIRVCFDLSLADRLIGLGLGLACVVLCCVVLWCGV